MSEHNLFKQHIKDQSSSMDFRKLKR
ncbi:MAG: hypothetical protein ACI97P_000034, partial [Arcticibacterium sp.]